jgi:hypothetical protein
MQIIVHGGSDGRAVRTILTMRGVIAKKAAVDPVSRLSEHSPGLAASSL